ncbi:hypothetical protein [Pedobacter sp.]|uniref:hypothetical protein n=1 Tax=Pedobacter sp. TaxID=1411316 RepID=UPI00396C65A0
MKTTININNKAVEIELTADQVEAIKKATTKYTDIKTLADAVSFLGKDDADVMAFERTIEVSLPKDVVAYMKLRIIVKALNGDKVMDYKTISENKYFPWFNAVGSGAGFSSYDYGYADTGSDVGSRLCFIDSDRAKYAGNQFKTIYNDYINAN